MKIQAVNKNGIEEIREFLANNHKKGGDHFTSDMLQAWASDAEFQISEGNGPCIEIPARDSVTGTPRNFKISNAGIDTQETED